MRQKVTNPWDLSYAEVDAMDELCEHGCAGRVAERLRISVHAVRSRIAKVHKKMGAANSIRCVVLWDRWRQGEGKGVPA